ncbi:hypothetical protein [Pseudoruminococcus massiliensis]
MSGNFAILEMNFCSTTFADKSIMNFRPSALQAFLKLEQNF